MEKNQYKQALKIIFCTEVVNVLDYETINIGTDTINEIFEYYYNDVDPSEFNIFNNQELLNFIQDYVKNNLTEYHRG